MHPLGKELVTCTGCAACAAACPLGCISMHPDDEGFLNPRVDKTACTDCGHCREICPVSQEKCAEREQSRERKQAGPLQVVAAWHLDDRIRRDSSSGGVFTALADNVLSRGGVVCGAAFDEKLIVKHVLVDKAANLGRLRGSKYVQSEVSPALYQQIRDLLNHGREIFFSGAPCQVAGLRANFGNVTRLLTCDIICHGVPSPLLFKRCLQYITRRGQDLVNLSFRDKTYGWKRFGMRYYFREAKSRFISMNADPYLLAFLRDYSLRPCCYDCKFTCTTRQSDLTLADFWGVEVKYPEYDLEDEGTSLLLVNTEVGERWLDVCRPRLFIGSADLATAVAGNRPLICPVRRPFERDSFYHDLATTSFTALIHKYHLNTPFSAKRTLGALLRRVSSVIHWLLQT